MHSHVHSRPVIVAGMGEEQPALVTCAFCGRQAEEGAGTLTWTSAVDGGRRQRFCDQCSRSHLRAMEGKLDSEYS